ncbi:transcription termination/antitermination protein NusG [soil metagenome]
MARSIRERLKQRAREDAGDQQGADEGDWYVVHTYSGYENKVRQNLMHRIESMDAEDRIFEIIVPTQEEIEIKAGQRKTVQKKIFPGYVLVKMIMDDEAWSVVRHTPGVTSFVGDGSEAMPLPSSEVDAIIAGMTSDEPRVTMSLSVGDAVRITDGPFSDFRGAVDEINREKGTVKVLVSFFGREVPVELDFLQVERES